MLDFGNSQKELEDLLGDLDFGGVPGDAASSAASTAAPASAAVVTVAPAAAPPSPAATGSAAGGSLLDLDMDLPAAAPAQQHEVVAPPVATSAVPAPSSLDQPSDGFSADAAMRPVPALLPAGADLLGSSAASAPSAAVPAPLDAVHGDAAKPAAAAGPSTTMAASASSIPAAAEVSASASGYAVSQASTADVALTAASTSEPAAPQQLAAAAPAPRPHHGATVASEAAQVSAASTEVVAPAATAPEGAVASASQVSASIASSAPSAAAPSAGTVAVEQAPAQTAPAEATSPARTAAGSAEAAMPPVGATAPAPPASAPAPDVVTTVVAAPEQAQQSAPVPQMPAEWAQRLQEQQAALANADKERMDTRSMVESIQRHVASLQGEIERLQKGGAEENVAARRASLREEILAERSSRDVLEDGNVESQGALLLAEAAAKEASANALRKVSLLTTAKAGLDNAESALKAESEPLAAAEARLASMVTVDKLQDCEARTRADREELATADSESSRLRMALADAISSGSDLPNMLKELEVLKESAQASSKRITSLEELNAQLQSRLDRLRDETKKLRKGAVDLHSEGELMREVIVQQSEELLRRVQDLTDERQTADADREHLLGQTTELLGKVDDAEARIARAPELETQCQHVESTQGNTSAEVERLRRTNEALCMQVVGEDGEGPFAGALRRGSMASGEEESLSMEVARLLRGKSSRAQGGGAHVLADAGALALRLQEALAQREESFWVERQRLSDRVTALERSRGGRTAMLLREYDAAAKAGSASGGSRGQGSGSGRGRGGSGSGAGVGAYAAKGREAASAAAGAVTGGLWRLREALG
eukprot:TRINITY_DN3315_c0_g6_i1.p1 TRINITY_DN3315_c0_g6~~TRINITY_DN3315_c0_g6_i1.p1  ORF type:complete len:835 (+),score=229.59 TRINITY_DN3315_c0_g6_i1:119-2623(+)